MRKFCLLEIRSEKKFLRDVQRYKGGIKVLWTMSKPELCFLHRGFPKLEQ